jgi:hypothetical protein
LRKLPSISYYVDRNQTSLGAQATWILRKKIITEGEKYTAEFVQEFKTKKEAEKARNEANLQETIRAHRDAQQEG